MSDNPARQAAAQISANAICHEQVGGADRAYLDTDTAAHLIDIAYAPLYERLERAEELLRRMVRQKILGRPLEYLLDEARGFLGDKAISSSTHEAAAANPSNRSEISDRLELFLLLLVRDEIPAGAIERVLQAVDAHGLDSPGSVVFSHSKAAWHLVQWAKHAAERLRPQEPRT